ncbi:MAG: MFS transporter [Alphaproteobacteria bacterium]|nr:MFS transporter [Alphaproteobacteria bacterium]
MALPSLSITLLRQRNFRYLLLTRMLVFMGLQAQAVVVGWQVYSLTGSVLLLGLTGLAEAVPALLAALYAGYIVDHAPLRRTYLLCLLALFGNTLILLVVTGGTLHLADHFVLIALFSGVFFSGLARSFVMPTTFSLVALIVPRADMASASSWQTAAAQMAMIGGPSLAGITYGISGASGAWLFVTALMALSLWTGSRIDINNNDNNSKRPPAWESIKQGWRFLLHNRTLLSIMSLDMLAVLFGGAVAILPAFAHEILHLGAGGLGILRAAPALGAILTALFFALIPMRLITGWRMFLVVAGFGLSMVGFGLSTTLWAAVLFLALSGAFDSVSMVIRGTLMQILTPDDMRGRVSSVNSMFIISSNEIGAFQSGVMAALIGLVPSIIFGGAGTLIVVAVTAWLSPGFRKLRVDT